MNYTKGPWAIKPMTGMAVHHPKYNCWIPQNRDDAKLIAAAPEMFEALEEIVKQGEIKIAGQLHLQVIASEMIDIAKQVLKIVNYK